MITARCWDVNGFGKAGIEVLDIKMGFRTLMENLDFTYAIYFMKEATCQQ
jgi:hypothetical protein